MANWYGAARSNYVRVKDKDGLIEALDPFPIRLAHNPDGLTCFLPETEDGDFPGFAYTEDDEEIEFDPQNHIVPFLEDNEVLILMTSGAEKLRYITGHATAYHPDGEQVLHINISDIYGLVKQTWGVTPTTAET